MPARIVVKMTNGYLTAMSINARLLAVFRWQGNVSSAVIVMVDQAVDTRVSCISMMSFLSDSTGYPSWLPLFKRYLLVSR